MEAWPSLLPLPSRDGYGIEPGEGILRTEMEGGPARQEEIFTDVPTQIPAVWHFTAWEYALFEAWYKFKGRQGAAWFSITLLSGLGLGEHEARFKGQYKSKSISANLWRVQATLEIRERPVLDEPELDIFLDTSLPDLQAAAAALHTLVNAELQMLMGA